MDWLLSGDQCASGAALPAPGNSEAPLGASTGQLVPRVGGDGDGAARSPATPGILDSGSEASERDFLPLPSLNLAPSWWLQIIFLTLLTKIRQNYKHLHH